MSIAYNSPSKIISKQIPVLLYMPKIIANMGWEILSQISVILRSINTFFFTEITFQSRKITHLGHIHIQRWWCSRKQNSKMCIYFIFAFKYNLEHNLCSCQWWTFLFYFFLLKNCGQTKLHTHVSSLMNRSIFKWVFTTHTKVVSACLKVKISWREKRMNDSSAFSQVIQVFSSLGRFFYLS